MTICTCFMDCEKKVRLRLKTCTEERKKDGFDKYRDNQKTNKKPPNKIKTKNHPTPKWLKGVGFYLQTCLNAEEDVVLG